MSKTLRSVIFFTFLIAFLVSAPLVVLYTAGYRVDWTHGRVVHTSVLNISSEPRGATVFVDGKRFTDKTPSLIDTVLPGEHTVRLELKDYLPWETSVDFESSVASVVGPITLFTDSPTLFVTELELAAHAVNPTRSALVYATQESSWLEVWLTTDPQDTRSLLMRLPYDEDLDYALSWSPDGNYILLASDSELGQELHVADTEGGSIRLPDELSQVDAHWWNVGTSHELIVRVDDQLTQYHLVDGTATPITYQADVMQTWDQRDVTVLNSNNRSVLSFQETEAASIITHLPLSTYEFVTAPIGLIGLHDTTRGRLILVDAQNLTQPILLNEEVKAWEWDITDNHLLYTAGFDLKQYHRSTHEFETLTRLSSPIDALHWYPLGSVAMYQSNGVTTALQIQGSDVVSTTELTTALEGDFWMLEGTETLFVLSEHEGQYKISSRVLQR